MEIVKKTQEYTCVKKRSGRYGVKDSKGQWLNGENKIKILSQEGLIKLTVAKKKEEPAATAEAETVNPAN